VAARLSGGSLGVTPSSWRVGRPVRDHADIDVLMLRRDQLAVQQALPGWQWQAADPPGSLRPWPPGERLPAGVHDIWCRPGPGESWRIQVMLDESSGRDWVSRRDERIRRPITSIGLVTVRGIPYLAPEIQLFYKAMNGRPVCSRATAICKPCAATAPATAAEIGGVRSPMVRKDLSQPFSRTDRTVPDYGISAGHLAGR